MLTATVLNEAGYKEALHGLARSYQADEANMPARALKLAGLGGGHSKFLESMIVWIDVRAPRYWWQEADTYRLSTKQSDSTMHTLMRRHLTQDDFQDGIEPTWLKDINAHIDDRDFRWCLSYMTLQNVWRQRRNHKLIEWHQFFEQVLPSLAHRAFIELGRPSC
jgi:hypothetical protein